MRPPCCVHLSGVPLPPVQQCKYFGVVLSPTLLAPSCGLSLLLREFVSFNRAFLFVSTRMPCWVFVELKNARQLIFAQAMLAQVIKQFCWVCWVFLSVPGRGVMPRSVEVIRGPTTVAPGDEGRQGGGQFEARGRCCSLRRFRVSPRWLFFVGKRRLKTKLTTTHSHQQLTRMPVIPKHLIRWGIKNRRNLVKEGQGVGASCGATKHCTPTTHQRGVDPPFQDEKRAPDPVRGKASQKLSCLAGEPATEFSCQDDQACPPTVTCELRIATLFPCSCPLQRGVAFSGTSWACSPVLRERAHQSGVATALL